MAAAYQPPLSQGRACLSASGPGPRVVTEVGHRSRSPVDAPPALHQFLIDEISTKGGEVRMVPRDDLIDLGLRVLSPRLKVLDQPSQYGEPLLALHWNADQAKPRVDEVLANARVVIIVPGESIARRALAHRCEYRTKADIQPA
jgi:hypothetical protein